MDEKLSIFEKQVKTLKREIIRVKAMDSVNEELQRLNWIFLHPSSQGMDVGYMERILKEENAEEKITSFFAGKFFNLPATIHLVDGIFKKRPFLKDYEYAIEESVVLCLQKDFRGAISTLLPVIEGTLRKYYVSKVGSDKMKTTKISDLLKSSEVLMEDYLAIKKKYFLQETTKVGFNLSIDQEKTLEKLNREYFGFWIKQLNRYLEKNLYHYYSGQSIISDNFNRHAIFHAFNENVDYSLANYLRLFNSISFLSWILGVANEGCSVLSEISHEDVIDKWADYLKIISVSESLTDVKGRIYGKTVESFEKYLSEDHLVRMKRPKLQIDSALHHFDFMKRLYKPEGADLLKLLLYQNSIKKEKKEISNKQKK